MISRGLHGGSQGSAGKWPHFSGDVTETHLYLLKLLCKLASDQCPALSFQDASAALDIAGQSLCLETLSTWLWNMLPLCFLLTSLAIASQAPWLTPLHLPPNLEVPWFKRLVPFSFLSTLPW